MPNWIEKHGNTVITVSTIVLAFAALVAIFDQRFDAVDQRLDAQDRYINQRFDAQDKYINQRFDAVNQRFDAQDRRLEDLVKDVSELRELAVNISERVSRNEGQIDIIREQMRIADTPSP